MRVADDGGGDHRAGDGEITDEVMTVERRETRGCGG
jgi:hypothetical protein